MALLCGGSLQNIRSHMYLSREGFLEHVNLIANNCITYNGGCGFRWGGATGVIVCVCVCVCVCVVGFNSELSRNARRMLEGCKEEMAKVCVCVCVCVRRGGCIYVAAFYSSMEGAMKLKFAPFCSPRDALSDGILFCRSQNFHFLAKNHGL